MSPLVQTHSDTNITDKASKHQMSMRIQADGHVGPVAPSINWMPLLTNGLLKPHLQCTIRLSSPLYPPRTLCVCQHVCTLICVYVRGGQSRVEFLNVSLWFYSFFVSRIPKRLCSGHIQFRSTFKHWRHSNVNKWFQWV